MDELLTIFIVQDGSDQSCKDIITELNEMEKKAKESGEQGETRVANDTAPQRGDIYGDTQVH
jgi:hypothetical protein